MNVITTADLAAENTGGNNFLKSKFKSIFFSRYKKPDGICFTRRIFRIAGCSIALMILAATAAIPVFASGNVSGAIESTWNAAQSQIKQVVNNVVFPVIDMILAILFFVKVATAYLDYRKHGQFDFSATRF